MQDYTKTLAHNIYENRKRLGMTQEDLAQKVGVTYQSVSKWELGISCPDITLLPELAKIFNVSIDELVGIETPVEEEQETKKESVEGQTKQKANQDYDSIDLESRLSDDESVFTVVVFKGKKPVQINNSTKALRLEDMDIQNLVVTSSLRAENLCIDNNLTVYGSINTESITADELTCNGSIQAETITTDVVDCNGSITTETLTVDKIYKK